MALSGLDIYKLLPGGIKPPHPKANCKECGFPTCLAFAMKLAAKQAELSACAYVSDEAKAKLSAAAAPPIRLITLSADGRKVEAGNETVLFRHEKTFYPPDRACSCACPTPWPKPRSPRWRRPWPITRSTTSAWRCGWTAWRSRRSPATPASSPRPSARVRGACNLPLVLMTEDPAIMAAGLAKAHGVAPLLCAATAANWEAMAKLAKDAKAPLVVRAATLAELAELTEKLVAAGVEDLVLDPAVRGFGGSLAALTQIRRLALKKNFRPLGYPTITFPYLGAADPAMEALLAGQQIAKYAGLVVLNSFDPARSTRCWCCAPTSSPTRRSRSRWSPASTRSTSPAPTRR